MNRRNFLSTSVGLASYATCTAMAGSNANSVRRDWRILLAEDKLDDWTFLQADVGEEDIHNVAEIKNDRVHFLGPKFNGEGSKPGYIATREEFANYHLRLDYRWGETRWHPRKLHRRNSGLLYHMSQRTGSLFPDCVEFQIEEGDVGDAIMIDTVALQGPLLGGTPLWPNWIPAFPEEYSKPVIAGGYARQWHIHAGQYEKLDDWNTVDLYAFEDQAAHLVNGRIVNTLYKLRKRNSSGELAPLTKGRIALEFEQAEVQFRNVMIRTLSSESISDIRRLGSD